MLSYSFQHSSWHSTPAWVESRGSVKICRWTHVCSKVRGGSEGWSGVTDFLVWKQNQIAKLGLGQAWGEGDGEDQHGPWEKASGNSLHGHFMAKCSLGSREKSRMRKRGDGGEECVWTEGRVGEGGQRRGQGGRGWAGLQGQGLRAMSWLQALTSPLPHLHFPTSLSPPRRASEATSPSPSLGWVSPPLDQHHQVQAGASAPSLFRAICESHDCVQTPPPGADPSPLPEQLSPSPGGDNKDGVREAPSLMDKGGSPWECHAETLLPSPTPT